MSQESVKQALLATIEGVKANPSAGNVVFRADTKWEEDVRCTVNIRDFAPMTIDEPPELGGQNSAVNPVEVVLAGLGTCQLIMYSAYASVMGIELESVEVSTRGYLDLQGMFGLDENAAPGFNKITFETKLNSPAGNDELNQLVETVEKFCPVLDILTTAQNVTGNVVINGQKAVEAA